MNLLVMPGLGSVMARRKQGYVQGALACLGVILAGVGVIGLFQSFLQGTFEGKGQPQWSMQSPGVRMTLGGLFIFVIGWGWALGTSIQVLRQAPAAPQV